MNDHSIRLRYKRSDYIRGHHGMFNVLRLILASGALVGWFVFAFDYLPVVIAIPLSVMACLIHQRELSEWIHESSHFNLVSDKRLNDGLIQWLAGYVFANDIKAHRFGHNSHHRQTDFFVEKDPDTRLFGIKTRKQFWSHVRKDVTGVTAFKMFFSRSSERCPQPTRFFMLKLCVYQGILLSMCWLSGYLPAYVVYYGTLVTIYPLMNRIRLYGQHMELGRGTSGGSSRTIDAGIFDRLFVTSRLMLYHHEHHSFPDLPYRALIEIPKKTDDPNCFSHDRWQLLLRLYRELSRD